MRQIVEILAARRKTLHGEVQEPFKGILGAEPDYPVGFGMVSPHLAKRLELADKLGSRR